MASVVCNWYPMSCSEPAGWCSGEVCARVTLRSWLSSIHGVALFLLLPDVLSGKMGRLGGGMKLQRANVSVTFKS